MIWLIGKAGMLGTDLGRAFTEAGLAWVGTDREVDFTDPQALEAFSAGKKIDWVVNCAAYTSVDKAEDEPAVCRKLNVEGPAHLARWSQAHGAAVIHISTDYVFPGTGNTPYRETDPVGPDGIYGATKADGEEVVRTLCPRHYILRTAWLYGVNGPNFIYTMLRLMASKDSLGVVADQWGAPTWTIDLARVLVELIRRGEGPWGTYHASGEGKCNWHQFAEAILEEGRSLGLLDAAKAVAVNALTTEQYPTKAKRPAWSVMSKDKLKSTFGLTFPQWRESLQGFMGQLASLKEERMILRGHVEYDLKTAQSMMDSGRYLYVAHCCQQAVEKSLKALATLVKAPRRIHDLVVLAGETGMTFSDPEARLFAELTVCYLPGRYEEAVETLNLKLNAERTQAIMSETEALCLRLSKHPAYYL